MNLSRPAPAPQRYLGIGLVVALHLAGIYALSAGLIRPPARPPALTTVRALPPDAPEPPPPTEPLRAAEPTQQPLQALPIPAPIVDVVIAQEPVVSTVPLQPGVEPSTGATHPRGEPVAAVPPEVLTQLQSASAVCATMPRPEVPVVIWSGEAVLQVLATVRGGRVVGSEFRVLQGTPDGKTRRALQRTVEAALAGYRCQGDATFQQDFAFRLD